MNVLLKRQLKKFDLEKLAEDPSFKGFLESVGKSYQNYEDQFKMLQRAMVLSSDELYEANQLLKKDAEQQQLIIDQLKNVVTVLKKSGDVVNVSELPSNNKSFKLVDLMEQQAQEIVEINKQREKLLEELAYQNNELSEYAHMVSHDLKSPLRSIDALTAWLKEDYNTVFDENGLDTLTLIRTNVEKMDSLITGILEYSTIDKNNYKKYPVDLDLMLAEMLGFINVPNHIQIAIVNKLPVVQGDKHRLQQLFLNLIVNAISYNDKEEGVIEVGFDSMGAFYQFYVRDNGKGIAEDYLEKIFKAFFKLENNPQSIGIGLSIVKKIVELYNGKIWVNSELDKGTTFYFTLQKE
ncbi:ATP-binding protein [Wenyingzhuangia sp. 2_MG-2023]|uniref:sensor histidine kinase n=1 Tax=Wenyingzhuangia sp. 2_MG-2023 TaxID=3062639 RepID=UPI0026E2D9AD|nr:HAMP domain-containing sensor histidine kinase [Wenyingzhuangia sp. 2_MG-2023]MDO6738199.1 HAMP domain-containing sensor histidine kinase [Wenyingzhuangia sp. 2_MG-2023]